MKTFALLLALKATGALAGCISPTDIALGKLPNPLVPFKPGQQDTSQCDFLGDVPYGRVPVGCADLEVLYGMVYSFIL
jgi:hypothetical protein